MPVLSLTDQKIIKIKAINSKRTDYHDSNVKGLILRVTPNGSKSWSMLYVRKSDKKRRRVTFGKYPRVSLAEARAQARDMLNKIQKGEDPAGEQAERARAETFAQLAELYIEKYAKMKKRTWLEDKRMIDHDLLPVLGAMKAAEVSKRDVINVIDAIAGRGAGYLSNRVLALMRKIYNWANEEDYLAVNPTLGVKKKHIEKSRTRFLNDDEVKKLWSSLDATNGTLAVISIIRLCLLTGQRPNEIAGLRKDELDFDNHHFFMRHRPEIGRTIKNKKDHLVPLAPIAFGIVSEAVKLSVNSPFVFPSPSTGKAILPASPTRVLYRNKDVINIDDFQLKDLRRTVATYMARLGIDRIHISKVLNHTTTDSESITGLVYDVYKYEVEKRQALESWENYLSEIGLSTLG